MLQFAKRALEGLDFGGCPGGFVAFIYIVKIVLIVNKDYISSIGILIHSIIDKVLFIIFNAEEIAVGFSVTIDKLLMFTETHRDLMVVGLKLVVLYYVLIKFYCPIIGATGTYGATPI